MMNKAMEATGQVGVDLAKSFSYNTIGNILTKSDVGTYSYPAPGQPRLHAVSSISGSVINTTFTYDANGNQIGGNGLTHLYVPVVQLSPSTLRVGLDLACRSYLHLARRWQSSEFVGVLWSGAGQAQQSGTRVSGFAYDPASGLMSQEVIEPDLAAFRVGETFWAIGGWILETSARAESLELIWQCMLCAMPAGWDVVAHQC